MAYDENPRNIFINVAGAFCCYMFLIFGEHCIIMVLLFLFQVTRFGCGSLSIGFGYSHSLFDGIGALNFLQAWAALSRGSDDHEQPLQQQNHSRELLLTTKASAKESIYNQFNSMPVQDLYYFSLLFL